MTEARWPAWIEQWVIPYLGEPLLRPVLFSLLAHAVVVLVPVVLDVIRTPSGWSVGLLGAALGVTAYAVVVELRALGRPNRVALSLVATWAGTLLFAWLADVTGTW